MSNNRGSSVPFYSITLAATNHRTNTKESCFIKSITGKNSQSKLIYHHSSHILQEPNKWFPSYRNQKDVWGCRGKGDEEDQTVFPGGAKWNKLLGNKYSSLLRLKGTFHRLCKNWHKTTLARSMQTEERLWAQRSYVQMWDQRKVLELHFV